VLKPQCHRKKKKKESSHKVRENRCNVFKLNSPEGNIVSLVADDLNLTKNVLV
jgi:hypothetical protein